MRRLPLFLLVSLAAVIVVSVAAGEPPITKAATPAAGSAADDPDDDVCYCLPGNWRPADVGIECADGYHAHGVGIAGGVYCVACVPDDCTAHICECLPGQWYEYGGNIFCGSGSYPEILYVSGTMCVGCVPYGPCKPTSTADGTWGRIKATYR